ncbi:TIGR04104 family putative zinc finger protein [Bacillus sp. OAE603]|uniref:TIGR04104 family putative zinc finger protein n=1 Tax=Gottfriedia sp. OAE603 TaxID=2663872 RepID=UPI00178BB950
MKLPKCMNCNYKLSWTQTFKQTMIVKRDPLQCQHCNHELFFTAKSKKRLFLLVALFPILFVILTAFQVPMILSIPSLIIYPTFIMLITPFLIEVRNDEEALF